MDKYNIFVSINYRDKDNNDKIITKKAKVNNSSISSTKYLIGGGFYNRKGGTVVFTARSLDEVKQITVDKPLLKNIEMNYNVAVIPKQL
ncbi:hypothetical protein [Clostridium sp. DJ247]|uniref:hypothetical protein n=1 Tax=Clostridium sp. DJ247 TaxID=2726188 RepID=UPI001627E5C7|nr:hypothetical protein [Clostridium sp. DJ247]MBC2580877.1 hypothetical protein [Clostridium sp. DJ247]